jgi:hypothetical protein
MKLGDRERNAVEELLPRVPRDAIFASSAGEKPLEAEALQHEPHRR